MLLKKGCCYRSGNGPAITITAIDLDIGYVSILLEGTEFNKLITIPIFVELFERYPQAETPLWRLLNE